jgi:tetratricopeptide (TPR) repeat protein
LGSEGAIAYEAGNYAEALDRFDRAFALLPAPSLGLWAARSCAKLGRLVEAEQRYRQLASLSNQIGDPAIQRQAQIEGKQELAELNERIPKLGVRVLGTAGQPAVVTLDDRPFESKPGQLEPVNPGRHMLAGTYHEQHVSLPVELAPGERRELVLAFSAPAASDVPSDSASMRQSESDSAKAWRTAGWVGVGAGGVALLTGIITRAVARSRYDRLQEQPGCTRRQCPPEARERIDSYNSMRSVSLITTISGAALGVAGTGVLLLVPKDSAPVSLGLSPNAVSLSGRF